MKGKEKEDCPTKLTYYARVHYPDHKFYVLTYVSTMHCHLFILLPRLFSLQFNPLMVLCFTFKLGLNRGSKDGGVYFFNQIVIWTRRPIRSWLAMLNKPHQLLFVFINAYGGQLIWSKTLVESFILVLNIFITCEKK